VKSVKMVVPNRIGELSAGLGTAPGFSAPEAVATKKTSRAEPSMRARAHGFG
jgi:hypothetical protein